MPHVSALSKIDNRTFAFSVTRDLGITTFNLAGTMAVKPVEATKSLQFLVEGRHVIGGTAVLDLAIRFDGDADHCVLACSGTMQDYGSVDKSFIPGETKVQERVKTAFADFRRRLERQQKASPARHAKANR